MTEVLQFQILARIHFVDGEEKAELHEMLASLFSSILKAHCLNLISHGQVQYGDHFFEIEPIVIGI